MNCKRSKKGWLKIILVLLFLLLLYCFGISRILSFELIIKQEENFHYNAVSLSSVLAGFQFTGISILLSVTDKPRIERLWNFGYLDVLYHVSFIGIIFNVITILSALCLVTVKIDSGILPKVIYFEIFSLIVGIFYFGWSVKELLFVVRKAKKDPKS